MTLFSWRNRRLLTRQLQRLHFLSAHFPPDATPRMKPPRPWQEMQTAGHHIVAETSRTRLHSLGNSEPPVLPGSGGLTLEVRLRLVIDVALAMREELPIARSRTCQVSQFST